MPSVLLDDDNFFDLLSRYQSRRIDDQRCSFRLTDGAREENKENTEPQIGYLYFLVVDQCYLSVFCYINCASFFELTGYW